MAPSAVTSFDSLPYEIALEIVKLATTHVARYTFIDGK